MVGARHKIRTWTGWGSNLRIAGQVNVDNEGQDNKGGQTFIRGYTAERAANNETAGQIRNLPGGGQNVKMAMHNDPKQRKAKYDGKG